jgi:predicted RNA-binding Zn-ribbon protein involved in translation (DUF1610 family)
MSLFSLSFSSGRYIYRNGHRGSGHYRRRGLLGGLLDIIASRSPVYYYDNVQYQQAPPPVQPAPVIICASCGAQIPTGSKFCLSCGKPVGPAVQQQPHGAAFCPNCGEAQLPNARFCQKCGVKLNP